MCGSNKAKTDQIEASQLIQFLTGLNKSYDNIRNQILVLDPLPHVNNAYSMVLRVERQRQVNLEFIDSGDNSALMGRGYEIRGNFGPRNNLRKGPVDKRHLTCEICYKTGHNKETCFKLHGVPEWYKELTNQRKKNGNGTRAYAVNDNNSVDVPVNASTTAGSDLVADIMEALRIIQTNKMPQDPVSVHFAQGDEMASMALNKMDQKTKHILALGRQVGKLYYLDKSSFVSVSPAKCNINSVASFSASDSLYTLWHKRLGHTSPSVLRHIPILNSVANNDDHAKGIMEWEHAMKEELAVLDKNNTWEVVDLPKGKRAIGSKCIFKLKLKPDGTVDRYKARLVAKSYNQVEGEDYIERFSPVAKAVTVRTLLAIASNYAWPIHQVDINNTFLHGYLEEDIYMLPPNGAPIQSGKVCKLKRSLYGLKQACRQWNQELSSKLLAYGFSQSQHEHYLFIKQSAAGILILLVYVDDVLLTGPSEVEIAEVKHFLDSKFTIKDLGPAHYFLGLENTRCTAGTSITQHKYVRDIIQDSGLTTCKPANTPLPIGVNLSAHHTDPLPDPGPYRRLAHMDAALHLVRYLKGIPNQGLFFPVSNSLNLTAFCDADWAGCIDSRRSLLGYCIFLSNALISWKSKKQPTVARSTAEAEYRSLSMTVCELKWISYLLQDLHLTSPTPIPLYCDNQAAIHIVANPVFHE
ncbi:UNVERIFIED_CONTAM: Retrovirus-related Pol polyprotein from transposon RE1 [Sesamum calycinum]|uniref:Retrovirus-related Pol polyprotein from transposon RE1 n=1 Tax=Sesamum calycinum TaxID=2727403 RepID=A0AAW2MN30_9LAMI